MMKTEEKIDFVITTWNKIKKMNEPLGTSARKFIAERLAEGHSAEDFIHVFENSTTNKISAACSKKAFDYVLNLDPVVKNGDPVFEKLAEDLTDRYAKRATDSEMKNRLKRSIYHRLLEGFTISDIGKVIINNCWKTNRKDGVLLSPDFALGRIHFYKLLDSTIMREFRETEESDKARQLREAFRNENY